MPKSIVRTLNVVTELTELFTTIPVPMLKQIQSEDDKNLRNFNFEQY